MENPSQEAKDSLQQTARNEWVRRGRKGTLAQCTGSAKTKVALDEMMQMWAAYKKDESDLVSGKWDFLVRPQPPHIFVAVPTEQLRDVDWPAEIRKWYGEEGMVMWSECVQAVCYISLHKYRGGIYDLVILDEGHHLTQLSAQFFQTNITAAVLCLTATFPDSKSEPHKYALLSEIAPVVFTYPLDQGVDEGVVSEFEINVILSVLDDRKKIIPAGNKKKPFLQTEAAAYAYQSKRITSIRIEVGNNLGDAEKNAKRLQFMEIARYRFMCNLPSKLRLAQAVIEREYTKHSDCPAPRTLVFAGSIEQCSILCGEQVYHSKTDDTALIAFKEKKISLLGCVKALNEGVNIPDLDQGIIVQVDSNPRSLIQRIGRLVRYREGHVSKVFILCVQNTVDESWLKSALAGFDPKRIKYLTAKSYMP